MAPNVAQTAPLQETAPLEAAREALEDREFIRAIEILTPVVDNAPTPDAYLLLGVAHANTGEYDRAFELLTEAAARYPADSRFHSEIAGVHLANRDVDLAAEALRRALTINPADAYAADLLASIELSQGRVEQALGVWNRAERPRIEGIFQNFAPGFVDRVAPRALAFERGDILDASQWKTTEARLFSTRLYSNVGLELEPAPMEDAYDAIVRTSPNRNTREDILFDLVRELPVWSTNLEFYDIGYSGLSWKSNFRFHPQRRRLRGQLFAPLPLPGLPVVEFGHVWRSENWNVVDTVRDAFAADGEFHYEVNATAVDVRVIPHFRAEITAGFEYRNRDVTGALPALAVNGLNSGIMRLGLAFRPFDGRFKNRIDVGGFLARDSVAGDFDFSGGTVEVSGRFEIDERAGDTVIDLSLGAGTSRGDVPIDHYFNLGIGSVATHTLRAHPTSRRGRYGRSPMGTDFVLWNSDFEHRLLTVPFFNTFSIPYVDVKAIGFFDAAKTFDRNRIFEQGELWKDVGGGIRFETPSSSFTILYGRDLGAGRDSLYGYVESRFW